MIEIATKLTDGATVVLVGGSARGEQWLMVADGIAALAEDSPVVVDIDGMALSDVASVRSFLAHLLESAPGSVVFRCSRLSGRRILRRWGGDGVPIHRTLSEALADIRVSTANHASPVAAG